MTKCKGCIAGAREFVRLSEQIDRLKEALQAVITADDDGFFTEGGDPTPVLRKARQTLIDESTCGCEGDTYCINVTCDYPR